MTAPEPVVTVITPAYNVEPWIGAAIGSVLAQTQERFEYLVVDDGSSDDTAAIAHQMAETDSRVRVIEAGHGGSASARNAGLERARAPYIAFLDGDDRWSRHFLDSQLEVLRRAPAAVGAVFCHTRVMLEGGQLVGLRWQPAGACDLDRLLAQTCPPHNGSSLLLRRQCFEEAGHFDASLPSSVDFDMWLRIAATASAPMFWGSRRYLVDMRLMRTGSVSSDRRARLECLDGQLRTYAPQMTRLHPGLAYVRPAVFAFRDGYDDIAEEWAAEARTAGRAALARDVYGQAMLVWSGLGTGGRARLRRLRDKTRARIYSGLARATSRTRAG